MPPYRFKIPELPLPTLNTPPLTSIVDEFVNVPVLSAPPVKVSRLPPLSVRLLMDSVSCW